MNDPILRPSSILADRDNQITPARRKSRRAQHDRCEPVEIVPAVPDRALNAHLWVRHPLDWYVEESWVDHRFFEEEGFEGSICDPACGLGRVVEAARAAGYNDVWGEDLVSRSMFCDRVADFLSDEPPDQTPDNICCNPPFRKSREFVIRAREIARRKVAMILPLSWISGDRRSRWLERTFPRRVLIISPRPSMPPGPVILAGLKARGGRTDFAWYIWERNYVGEPSFGWLRRKR
ncbi:SAM-dependent methyltransferase [Methylosinus sp. LW3]|uniref:SAM-dependent methyltransferase n=1 Tax=Methylosinus sp. LW3 TaxID=107635 RepID=UPI0004671AEE|nr:SAM-dependent methyltransferase [Methylosinus sp. LW3]